MKLILGKVFNTFILHGMVIGNWMVFQLVKMRDVRFRKALEQFDATYQFRTGPITRRLIFADGCIKTCRRLDSSPDYEIVLLDPPGVVKRILKNPDDIIKLLMENKIDQRGNNYYLFRFGYLLGLCDRYFQELIEKHTFLIPLKIRQRMKAVEKKMTRRERR